MKITTRVSRLWPLTAGVVACLALGARHAAAQHENVVGASGGWFSLGALAGGALFDGNTSRTWDGIGDPGPGVGFAVAAGYDARHLGAALDIERVTMKVGDRRGRSLALAATLRWQLPQPSTRWDSRLEVGYVRLGFGAEVGAGEIPSGLFRGGVPDIGSFDQHLTLLGNGIRLGVSIERELTPRTNLLLGLGADAVYFDNAAYRGNDLSLTQPGWGVMPRLLLGVRTFPHGLRR